MNTDTLLQVTAAAEAIAIAIMAADRLWIGIRHRRCRRKLVEIRDELRRWQFQAFMAGSGESSGDLGLAGIRGGEPFCIYCGCTEARACDVGGVGCHWISRSPFVCSAPACMEKFEASQPAG